MLSAIVLFLALISTAIFLISLVCSAVAEDFEVKVWNLKRVYISVVIGSMFWSILFYLTNF